MYAANGNVLTLAANNTSTGTLSIKNGATVVIAKDANWAGAINVEANGILKAFVGSENIMANADSDNGVICISETLGSAGTVVFADGSKLVLDLAGVSDTELRQNANKNDVVMLKIVSSVALDKYDDLDSIAWSEDNGFTVNGTEVGDNKATLSLENGSTIIRDWVYDNKCGSLLLSIPEPSLFGLFVGLGALALVGSRRRRK